MSEKQVKSDTSAAFMTSVSRPKTNNTNVSKSTDANQHETSNVSKPKEVTKITSDYLIKHYSNPDTEHRKSLSKEEANEAIFSPNLKLDEERRKSMGRISVGRSSTNSYHQSISFMAAQHEIERFYAKNNGDSMNDSILNYASDTGNNRNSLSVAGDDKHSSSFEDAASLNTPSSCQSLSERDSMILSVQERLNEYNEANPTDCVDAVEDYDNVGDEELQDEFNPFLFIKTLPPYEYINHNIPKCLPPKDKNTPMNTLVLDLDETLVHCNIGPIDNPDSFFSVDFEGYSYDIYVKIRPFFYYFLEQVSKLFEVVIFTASQQVYADELLNILDPDRKYIKYRVFRDSCIIVDGNYIKDLSVLNRDLAHVVIIDNSPHAFGYNLDNGIPIKSWFDDPNDKDLLLLVPFLRQLSMKNDVRPSIRIQYNLKRLIDNIQCEELY